LGCSMSVQHLALYAFFVLGSLTELELYFFISTVRVVLVVSGDKW
jgi:hypothetical protein